jgi:dTDP-4-amino-4,6-dideoxygalactose transaminase
MTGTPGPAEPSRSRPDPEGPVAAGAAQLGDEEIAAVEAVLRSQMLYRWRGCHVARFERRFAEWLEADVHTLAVNSGTAALELALEGLALEPGDEVLVPSVGFISTATAVHAVGAVPRFVGVGPSLCIEAEAAEAAGSDRTKVLLAVHVHGSACDIDALRALTERKGWALVEDVAQACGARFHGARLGTFGAAAAFSFQHFKLLSIGEGGMVVTRDRAAFERAAFAHDTAATWTMSEIAQRVGEIRMTPRNLRMSEIEGALGVIQLERCDQLVKHLRSLKGTLHKQLEQVPGLELRPHADSGGEAGTSLIFFLPSSTDAQSAAARLRLEGVNAAPLLGSAGTNRHWAGDWVRALSACGARPPEFEQLDRDRRILERGVLLPIDPRWSARDLAETAEALGKVFA